MLSLTNRLGLPHVHDIVHGLRREPRFALLHFGYNVVGTQNSMCEKCIVNESGSVAIPPFRVLWGCRRIFHDGYLETLLQ